MPFVEGRFSLNAAEDVESTNTSHTATAIVAANATIGKQSVYIGNNAAQLPITPPIMPLAFDAATSNTIDLSMPMGNLAPLPATTALLSAPPPRMSVDDALRHQLANIEFTGAEDNAFFIADVAHLHRQHQTWTNELPQVHPYYAVKCNPSPPIIQTLASLGVNFDCASKVEIQSVLEAGVSPDRIIYANPCKQLSHIRYAVANGVRMMTFDNADELHKVYRVSQDVKMILRILVDDSKSFCQLGLKFGAPMESIESLLAVARDLNVHLAGVSFHVGSGCYDAEAFGSAVQRAKTVFDLAPLYGHNDMRILDIGGGFPGSKLADIKFEQIAGILRTALSEYFPIDSGIQLIAEPGRYFVENAFTLAVNVIARRVVYDDKPEGENGVVTDSMTNDNGNSKPPSYMYYINDGMYGSFNCIMFDHVIMKTPGLLMREGQFHGRDHPHQRPEYLVNRETPTLSLIGFSDSDDDSVELSTPNEAMSVEGALMAASPMPPGYRCSIWGPTCDSIDCVNPRCVLPELRVGDWLRYDGMGAYTLCAASQFNGFKQSRVIYIDTTDTCLHTAATKNGNFH